MPPVELLDLLKLHGVSFSEWNVLLSVGYGIRYPDCLTQVTAGESLGRFGAVSLVEAEEAVQSCLAKGWLQVVDEPALRKMRQYLESRGVKDFDGSLPLVREIDFTPAGAELHQRVRKEWNGPDWPKPSYVSWKQGGIWRAYSETLEDALDASEDYRRDPNLRSISAPIPVGPWSALTSTWLTRTTTVGHADSGSTVGPAAGCPCRIRDPAETIRYLPLWPLKERGRGCILQAAGGAWGALKRAPGPGGQAPRTVWPRGREGVRRTQPLAGFLLGCGSSRPLGPNRWPRTLPGPSPPGSNLDSGFFACAAL
jgi:hypothetical protein